MFSINIQTARFPYPNTMSPNIRQRKDAANRGKPHKRKVVGLFNNSEYKKENHSQVRLCGNSLSKVTHLMA